MDGIRLHWLEITRYRNVVPGTKLSFGRKLNLVLGRNGAGKSALLSLLAAILTGKFERLAEEPLRIVYCLTAASLQLTVGINNDPGDDPAWSVDLEVADADQVVCTVSSVEGEGTIEVPGRADSYPLTLSSPFDGSSLHEVLEEIADVLESERDEDDDDDDEDDDEDLHEARVTAMLRTSGEKLEAAAENGCRFGEGLAAFQAITGEILEGLGDPDWAYLNVRVKGGRADSIYASFAPDELRTAIKGKKLEAFDAAEMVVFSSEVPFLRKAAAALGAHEVTLTLPLEREDKGEGQVSFTSRELKLGVVRGGAPIPHERLSYGEKRLLSFFYYAAAHPHVLLVDDLLNGMTHGGALAAIEEIGERQAFVSSLDPLLFAFVPRPGDDERTLIACTAEKGGGEPRIAWENLDYQTASSIIEARGAGVQEVGKVLRARGLW